MTNYLIDGHFGRDGGSSFETVIRTGQTLDQLQHWSRDNVSTNLAWFIGNKGMPFVVGDVTGTPSLIQSSWGNFEVVVRINDQLQHWFRDNKDPNRSWHMTAQFGSNFASAPSLIETSWGNLELVVVDSDKKLQHWYRDKNNLKEGWINAATFGSDFITAPSLIQSSWSGNFELVVVDSDKKLQHWWRDEKDPNRSWHMSTQFASDFTDFSAPSLIQSSWGNFELVIAEEKDGIRMQHWFRDNKDPNLPWNWGGTFDPLGLPMDPSLIQSSWSGNFEVLVPFSNGPRRGPFVHHIQHWWRDEKDPNRSWHQGERLY